MLANGLTKALPIQQFRKFRDQIRLLDTVKKSSLPNWRILTQEDLNEIGRLSTQWREGNMNDGIGMFK